MSFLASQGVLGKVLADASVRALHTKTMAQQIRNSMAAGDSPSGTIIGLDAELRRIRAELVSHAATPGIADYAKTNTPNAPVDYDVVAEWNGMIAAIDGVTSQIRAEFPVGTSGAATGFLLSQTWGAGGPVDRVFTPAQTVNLRARLDTLIASIA